MEFLICWEAVIPINMPSHRKAAKPATGNNKAHIR